MVETYRIVQIRFDNDMTLLLTSASQSHNSNYKSSPNPSPMSNWNLEFVGMSLKYYDMGQNSRSDCQNFILEQIS